MGLGNLITLLLGNKINKYKKWQPAFQAAERRGKSKEKNARK